ncbi:hypothetical protein PFISCL1PPCAC_16704, partial [Pristionchus fissidentatus]
DTSNKFHFQESARTHEISQTGSEKKKRQYKLKNDAQRKDPNYQRKRENNNKSVEKCRQKNKEKEEEARRKNEEEKELLRSTLKKVVEMHE